jgi:hypothetical protein
LQQSSARVLARRGSRNVYNTIPKSQKWLTINCVVNATFVTLITFYIFRGSRMQEDYIKLCKLGTYMAMQKKKLG